MIEKFNWTPDKSNKVPTVWFSELECLQVHYNEKEKKLCQKRKKPNHPASFYFENLQDGRQYGYVVNIDRILYVWPIDQEEDEWKKIGLLRQPTKTKDDYVGHLTIGAYKHVKLNMSEFCPSCKDFKDFQQYCDNNKQEYAARFKEIYNNNPAIAVFAAGEFELDIENQNIQISNWGTNLQESGHYKPFEMDENQEGKMKDQLLALSKYQPIFKKLLEDYDITSAL